MKRLLVVMLMLPLITRGQKSYQRTTSENLVTIMEPYIDSSFTIPSYDDTSAANYIRKHFVGELIYTRNPKSVWLRSYNMWLDVFNFDDTIKPKHDSIVNYGDIGDIPVSHMSVPDGDSLQWHSYNDSGLVFRYDTTTSLQWHNREVNTVKPKQDEFKPGVYSVNYATHTDKPTYDTIPVIMLVCDTSMGNVFDNYQLWVYGKKGYEIRLVNPNGDYVRTNLAIYIPVTTYSHVEYLDADKHPLSKSIIVWMTK